MAKQSIIYTTAMKFYMDIDQYNELHPGGEIIIECFANPANTSIKARMTCTKNNHVVRVGDTLTIDSKTKTLTIKKG